jgi:hypothetical protein
MEKELTLNQRVNVTIYNVTTIMHETTGKIVGNGITWPHGDKWWIVLLDTPYNAESALLLPEYSIDPCLTAK